MILIDSNVIIDIIECDPVWMEWSYHQVATAGAAGSVAINSVVIAETAPNSSSLEVFTDAIKEMGILFEPICERSAYQAGVAFQKYRARRLPVKAKSIIADFLIGGHAQTLEATILTRDPRFYRTYFPTVPLLTPSKDKND